jgi:hypothetical protein
MDPFVKNKPVSEFKLPSAATPHGDKFKGFDYRKATRFSEKLDIKNKTRPFSDYQKSKAFNGSEIEYNREFGGKDELKKFKDIESGPLNHN